MKVVRILLIAGGLLCVGLGTLGIFLPILPTTPFYLLAVFCFAKGSQFFHQWFTGTKIYKKHLESYANSRSMTIKTKLGILIPVTVMLFLSALLVNIPIMRIVIVVLLLIKYWYFIFKIKTIQPAKLSNPGSAHF